jgi:hypothetical protein
MKNSTKIWALGITVILIAGAAWLMQMKPPSGTKPKTVTLVKPAAAPALPDSAFLQGLSTPAPAAAKKRAKPPAKDPAARAALKMVGVDATAELIWMEAINNPKLSNQERQDLIEDLNEEGLTNRKQPVRADLSLIQARLKIISRLMPESMDQTNLDAFAEARKDLINMQAKLTP